MSLYLQVRQSCVVVVFFVFFFWGGAHSGSVEECLTERLPRFEPHRRHCAVSLSKTHKSLLRTQGDLSRHKRNKLASFKKGIQYVG